MYGKEEEEMATPHFPISGQQTLNSFPQIKHRKPLETKSKLTQKRTLRLEPVILGNPGGSKSHIRKRKVNLDIHEPVIAKTAAMVQAEKVQANLDAKFPSFVKAMVRTTVTHGFWLHIPMPFCKLHLPRNEITVTLEDQNGEEYAAKYLVDRSALSGGWRKFSSAHNLLEGDVLVFHLVEPSKFKVYIVRGGGLDKRQQGVESKPVDSDRAKKDTKSHKRFKHPELKFEKNSLKVSDANNGHFGGHRVNNSEHISSPEGIKNSVSNADFEGAKSINSFKILVNGFTMDSQLSENYRRKYYELCCSQNSLLHENLVKSISYYLAAEIISETVNIADAIRACRLTTRAEDYAVWDKTLTGFELLGMNVGFLRSRLKRIKSLTLDSQVAADLKSYREARLEQARAKAEARVLEMKLLKLKEMIKMLDFEVEELRVNAENHELMLQEEICSVPW